MAWYCNIFFWFRGASLNTLYIVPLSGYSLQVLSVVSQIWVLCLFLRGDLLWSQFQASPQFCYLTQAQKRNPTCFLEVFLSHSPAMPGREPIVLTIEHCGTQGSVWWMKVTIQGHDVDAKVWQLFYKAHLWTFFPASALNIGSWGGDIYYRCVVPFQFWHNMNFLWTEGAVTEALFWGRESITALNVVANRKVCRSYVGTLLDWRPLFGWQMASLVVEYGYWIDICA